MVAGGPPGKSGGTCHSGHPCRDVSGVCLPFDHSRFYGDAGVLDLPHWAQPTYTTGDASRTAAPGTGEPVELIEPDDHYLNWLKCIRSRGTCVAPIEAGYQHAVATLMAVKEFDQRKRQVYDADRREIVPG